MKSNKKKNMKTLKFYCKLFVIMLFAGLFINVVAAQTAKKEQVTKVYEIDPTGKLQIISVGSDIEIFAWDRDEVQVTGELTYKESDNKEDIDKLLNAFKNMDAQLSNDVLKLDLKLIVSAISHNNTLSRKMVTTTVLCNGDKISINAINIKTAYTIWIPENLVLYIDSKDGKLEIEEKLRK